MRINVGTVSLFLLDIYNWLRVFAALEFAYKPQRERVFVDTSEPVRIPLLWCSRWRNASHGKGFQRI